jgi:hypothetical protein
MIQIGHGIRKQSERDASTPRRKQRRKLLAEVAFLDDYNSLKQQKPARSKRVSVLYVINNHGVWHYSFARSCPRIAREFTQYMGRLEEIVLPIKREIFRTE